MYYYSTMRLILIYRPSEGGRLSRPRHCSQCAAHAQSCVLQWISWKHKLLSAARFQPGPSRAAGKRATTRQPLRPMDIWITGVKTLNGRTFRTYPTPGMNSAAAAAVCGLWRYTSVICFCLYLPSVSIPMCRSPDISRLSDCWIERCATFWYSANTARSCAWLLEHRIWLNLDSSVPHRASPAWYSSYITDHNDITPRLDWQYTIINHVHLPVQVRPQGTFIHSWYLLSNRLQVIIVLYIMCKLSNNDIQKVYSKYNILLYESTLSQIKYGIWSISERTCTYFFSCRFIFLLYFCVFYVTDVFILCWLLE